jgi:hypothetical protein
MELRHEEVGVLEIDQQAEVDDQHGGEQSAAFRVSGSRPGTIQRLTW